MKNLLLILFALLLFSCHEPTKVENPQKETTIEILTLANADTTFVKVVEINDVTYVVNNGLVTHRVTNQSGSVLTLTLILIIVITVAVVLISVILD